jgi:hypothetical protein
MLDYGTRALLGFVDYHRCIRKERLNQTRNEDQVHCQIKSHAVVPSKYFNLIFYSYEQMLDLISPENHANPFNLRSFQK